MLNTWPANKTDIYASLADAVSLSYPADSDAVIRQTTSFLADLNSRFAQRITITDFGAMGDGVTDDTAALQAAIQWSVSNQRTVYGVPGKFITTKALTIPASAKFLSLWLPVECRIEAQFSSQGSSGLLTNADLTGAGNGTTRPQNVIIIGGDWGRPYTAATDESATKVDYNGNTFGFMADNCILIDVRMTGLTNGRFFAGGGNNLKIIRPTWIYATKTTGAGGCRIVGGGGLCCDGTIKSGDDAFQVVPAESGVFANLSVTNFTFRDMVGVSWAARLCVATITDQDAGSQPTFTCSINQVNFIRCNGSAYGFACNFSNIDSTGQLGEVNLVDCDITDNSPPGSISTPYAILVDGGSGLSRGGKMGVGIIRVIRTIIRQPQKNGMKVSGEVGVIELDDPTFQAPQQVDGATIQINRAQKLTVRRGQYSPGLGQNVFQLGLSGDATATVLIADFDGFLCTDVPDLGDGSFNYGINFIRGGSATVRGRCRVEPRAASAFVRFCTINANFTNVDIQSADLRPITAAAQIIDNGLSTTYGYDILTASGNAYRRGFQTIAQSTSTVSWDGLTNAFGQGLIRIQLTGNLTIDTVTPAITPKSPVRVTIRSVTAGFSLTVNNTGNISMPAAVVLPQNGTMDIVWDPASATWIGVN